MPRFYEELGQPGTSKIKALQRAQLALHRADRIPPPVLLGTLHSCGELAMNTREVSCDAPRALSGGMHEGQSPSGRGARSDGTLPPFALRMLARSLRGVGRVPRAVLLIPVAVGLLYGAEAFAQVPTQIRLTAVGGALRARSRQAPARPRSPAIAERCIRYPATSTKSPRPTGKRRETICSTVSRRSISVPPTYSLLMGNSIKT